jgi:hypothetical protein
MERCGMDVNSGRVHERESGRGVLRVRDQNGSVEGMPEVPPELAALLLPQPVVAEVVDLLGHAKTAEGRPGTEVLLDEGSQEGMQPG